MSEMISKTKLLDAVNGQIKLDVTDDFERGWQAAMKHIRSILKTSAFDLPTNVDAKEIEERLKKGHFNAECEYEIVRLLSLLAEKEAENRRLLAKLDEARAKIAKVRYSADRLVDESRAYGNDCPSGRCEF